VAAEGTPLLHVLRGECGLSGPRFGCGAEQCGACVVLVDGAPTYACTMGVEAVAGRRVTTVEGLGSPDAPHPLQRAFLDEQAGQCGFCLSGILVAAAALLAREPDPDDAAIREALDPHLCRCGSHNRIIRAVKRAATEMRA
jgi:nicotinate dehydrogenase subunit A